MDGGQTTRAADGRTSASLRVYLLGRFVVVRDDVPIPAQAWRRRRPADVLKLAALAPGRRLARDAAIATLWPDKDPASGADNLHRALYDLRQILGGRWVDLDRGELRLEPSAWVDVDAFEAAAAEPSGREAAVALYRGDLAPEDPHAPWLAARRAALRARLADVAAPLAEAAAARGDAALALSLLRRVLEADPAREGAIALLVRLLAEAGRRADALRELDAFDAAARARGEAPAESLRALRDAVLRGALSPPAARATYDGYRRVARRLLGTPEPPPLRGRTGSLVLLESLVQQGSGALLLLGESGVGKTRLAVEGARIAQAAGALVLAGACDPVRAVPYGVIADALAEYRRGGGALAADPFAGAPAPGEQPEAEKARLFEAIRTELAAVARGRRVYLLLDDLHEVDESSANLLHALARAARALGLMLVGTCREDAVVAGRPVQMLLAHLDCERLARGVRVQRLDLAASRAQLADLLGSPPSDALAAQLYRQADGNPFHAEQLVRAFAETGQLRAGDDPAAVLRARVARLGPGAAALLEMAAVAGQRFDLDLVRTAAGLGAADVLGALDQALEAHLLDEDAAGYHFHHELVREAVYAALSPARRVAAHRALADAVEARAAGAPGGIEDEAELLGHHRRAADQPDRAFGHLITAGHRAAARAGLPEAHAFYQAAVALADAADASGPRRLELLEALADVQLAQADLGGAVQAYGAAAALRDRAGWRPEPEQRARARRGAALALLVAGRPDAARAELDAALADALSGAGDERAEVLLLLAQLAWHQGRPAEAREAARRCVDEARALGDAGLAGRGADMLALAAAALGEAAPAGALEPSEPGPERPFEIHLVLWEDDLLGDRTADALGAEVAALADRAARRRAPSAMAVARAVAGALAAREGQLDLAEAALREALRLSAGVSALTEVFAAEQLASVLTLRGQLEEAREVVGAGVLAAERALLRRHALTRMQAALARNRLAAGALYAAEDAAREASALLAHHGECAVCHALVRPELVRIALARGRPGEAEVEASELEALAARRGGRGLAAVAHQARARVLAAIGEPLAAASAFVRAAEAYDAVGARLDAAGARAGAAQALRACGADRLPDAEALARGAAEVLARAGVPVVR